MSNFKQWSAPLLVSLVIPILAITTHASVKNIPVSTVNHTLHQWHVKECVNNKNCVMTVACYSAWGNNKANIWRELNMRRHVSVV